MSLACTQAVTNFVDLDALSPATLRHLAAIKERAARDRYDDTDAMAEELAQCCSPVPDRPSGGIEAIFYASKKRDPVPTAT